MTWSTFLQGVGALLGAALFEFLRRLGVRQKKVAQAIDWVGETLDGPNPGQSIRPFPRVLPADGKTPSKPPPPAAA